MKTPCSWPPPSVRSLSPELPYLSLYAIASHSTLPIPIPTISPLFLSLTFAVAHHFRVSPKDKLPNRPLQIVSSNTISLFKTDSISFLIPNHIERSLQVVSSNITLFPNTNYISSLASSYINHSRQVAPSNAMLLPNTNSIFFLASSYIKHPLQVVSSNIMLFLNTNSIPFAVPSYTKPLRPTSISSFLGPLRVVANCCKLSPKTKKPSRSSPVVDSHIILFCKTDSASFVAVSYNTPYLKCKTNSAHFLICPSFLCLVFLLCTYLCLVFILCTNRIACGASQRITNISP